jgi:hypothetical protein
LQEEIKEKPILEAKTKQKANDLPKLEDMPVFMELLMIGTDESGKTRFNRVPAFALVASFTLTI